MRDLPVRKNIRLKEFDYSQPGRYFITICVKCRHAILARIVGDAAAIGGRRLPPSFGVPSVQLTEAGEIVKKHIERINCTFEDGHLDHYVIMPDHVHLLICINIGTPRAASPTKAAIPKIINALKSLSSKDFGESMWQRSYHDRIIRSEAEYQQMRQYMDQNPARWLEKRSSGND